jgi:hypothetical protein
MKLKPLPPAGQRYAVAIRDVSGLWLTLWVNCNRRGEIIILMPRGERDWDPHATYHRDGTFHQKSYDVPVIRQKRQLLTAAFSGSEHLGIYQGHSTSIGQVYNPGLFSGGVIVEPGILGSVGVDLVEPGYLQDWNQDDMCQRFYFGGIVHQPSPRHSARLPDLARSPQLELLE